ncbi:hypothetical protein, partial [Leucobacter sp. M11]|uniref:hypothetical protein n=1 Tax=Leucobacter sp. M11 TaxID=2993565 RepID=UPI002D7EF407
MTTEHDRDRPESPTRAGGFVWQPDVSVGAWLAERIDRVWSTPGSHHVVPRGYPAAIRLFHAPLASRPAGMSWAELAERDRRFEETGVLEPAEVEFEDRRVPWREVAEHRGVPWTPTISWEDILGEGDDNPELVAFRGTSPEMLLPGNWRLSDVEEGRLDPEALAALAASIARHDGADTAVTAAIWEGWGSLFASHPPEFMFAVRATGDEQADLAEGERYRREAEARYAASALSAEIEHGPRLELPAREYLLFRGSIGALSTEEGVLGVPWANAASFDGPEGIALLWPDDRSWVLVTEIDANTSVLVGEPGLLASVLAEPGVEAALLPEGTLDRV